MWGVKNKSTSVFEDIDNEGLNTEIKIEVPNNKIKGLADKIDKQAIRETVKSSARNSIPITSNAINYLDRRLPQTPQPRNTKGVFKRNRMFEL